MSVFYGQVVYSISVGKGAPSRYLSPSSPPTLSFPPSHSSPSLPSLLPLSLPHSLPSFFLSLLPPSIFFPVGVCPGTDQGTRRSPPDCRVSCHTDGDTAGGRAEGEGGGEEREGGEGVGAHTTAARARGTPHSDTGQGIHMYMYVYIQCHVIPKCCASTLSAKF